MAYDRVFWCGDLNYRVDRSRQEALELLERRELALLLVHDQLTQQRVQQKVFADFTEGPINFWPTFKVNEKKKKRKKKEKKAKGKGKGKGENIVGV